ncbi:unnamed protein product [Amoebophrya sp. A25]|nr:unnamed protein product [Amoebophrya sp. A25]|eukprot:GSA25T00009756001.1
MSAFEVLGVCPEIIQAIEEDDWLLPTPVQDDAIPLILGGGDVLAAAETGSGKTGAFGLPCLQIVHETLRGKCVTKANAEGASNLKCELNLNDKDMFVLVTEDGLECKSDDHVKWNGIRANIEVQSGRYYYEVLVVDGLCRVGWGASFAKLELGSDDKSFGYGGTGKKSWNRKFEDYGETFQSGDVVGCFLDRSSEKAKISFSINGRPLGVAYELDVSQWERIGLKPHICGKGFNVECRFDKSTRLEYPHDGYTPIGEIDPKDTPQGLSGTRGKRPLLCMILEPTRDLAEQTYKCILKFSKYLENPRVKVALFVGGVDEKEQYRALQEGVDICVGTLQKTLDHVRRGKLDVSQVKFLVLDEADDLQKKDDRKEIPKLNAQIKRGRRDRVQTLFFSATLHTPEVQTMISDITTRPIWVDLKGKDSVPDTVHHVVYKVNPKEELKWVDFAVHSKNPNVCIPTDEVHTKPTMSDFDRKFPEALKLSERIKRQKFQLVVKIADAFKMTQCLCFCRTNVDCNNLEKYLNTLGGCPGGWRGKTETGKENPYSCVVLAGMRDQDERRQNLEAFKEGDIRFLICTDVAARGIDIQGLPYLIMVTLPDDIENYIHRVGRVGRAERAGLAISLVATEKEKVWYHKCKSRGKDCQPWPGNTRLTIPFGTDGKLKARDPNAWVIDEGGCSIWYDEPDLVQKVEKRIGMPLKEMNPDDFSIENLLPSPLTEEERRRNLGANSTRSGSSSGQDAKKAVAEKSRRGKQAATANQQVVYGKKQNEDVSTKKTYTELVHSVVELANLERYIQQRFVSTASNAKQRRAARRRVDFASVVTERLRNLIPASSLAARKRPSGDVAVDQNLNNSVGLSPPVDFDSSSSAMRVDDVAPIEDHQQVESMGIDEDWGDVPAPSTSSRSSFGVAGTVPKAAAPTSLPRNGPPSTTKYYPGASSSSPAAGPVSLGAPALSSHEEPSSARRDPVPQELPAAIADAEEAPKAKKQATGWARGKRKARW